MQWLDALSQIVHISKQLQSLVIQFTCVLSRGSQTLKCVDHVSVEKN